MKGHGTHLEVRLGREQRGIVKQIKEGERQRRGKGEREDKCWFGYDISLKAESSLDI